MEELHLDDMTRIEEARSNNPDTSQTGSVHVDRHLRLYASIRNTATHLLIDFRQSMMSQTALAGWFMTFSKSMGNYLITSVGRAVMSARQSYPNIFSRGHIWLLYVGIVLMTSLSIDQTVRHEESNAKPFFSQPLLIVWTVSAIYTAYMGCKLLSGFSHSLATFVTIAAGAAYRLAFAQDPSNTNSVVVLGVSLGVALDYFWCGLNWSAPEISI